MTRRTSLCCCWSNSGKRGAAAASTSASLSNPSFAPPRCDTKLMIACSLGRLWARKCLPCAAAAATAPSTHRCEKKILLQLRAVRPGSLTIALVTLVVRARARDALILKARAMLKFPVVLTPIIFFSHTTSDPRQTRQGGDAVDRPKHCKVRESTPRLNSISCMCCPSIRSDDCVDQACWKSASLLASWRLDRCLQAVEFSSIGL